MSAADYPWEENEDPFLWRNARGDWHALFHACTWGDSREQIYPVPQFAGRHAFSVDGVFVGLVTTVQLADVCM